MPRLTAQQSEDKKQALLNAAQLCFAEDGFHTTTMQTIAQRAGVSIGLLYLYFASKEALIEGICARERAQLTAALDSIPDGDELAEQMLRIIFHYVSETPAYERRYFLMMAAETLINPSIHSLFLSVDTDISDKLSTLIERRQVQGALPTHAPAKQLAQMIVTIAEGLMMRRAIIPDSDIRQIIPLLTSIIHTILVSPHPKT